MNEPILVYSYIHERAELRYVCYNAFEFLSFLDILDFRNIITEFWRFESCARVATGFHEFGDDIFQSRFAYFICNIAFDIDFLGG